jgi:predicted SnoaL-like aldol condensation-catalyzing enzyme
MATEQERNKALVLQMYEEVWNKGNLDFIRTAVSPDFKDHPPTRFFEVPIRGQEALYEAATHFRAGMPDFHDQMINIVAEGDRVVYVGRITGTHTRPFFDFAPTGKKVSVLGINDFRLANGRIVERWGIFDVMGMMQQMGVIPAPPAGH